MVQSSQSILVCNFISIQKSESTYDGVLSGFGNLSEIDIKGSEEFLSKYLNELKEKSPSFQPNRVLDCGAGIGRIAK